jgi:outer membrane protein OmpA-like peptidoglycan-associated protein
MLTSGILTHTDYPDNMALSDARSLAVYNHLIFTGVSPERLDKKAFSSQILNIPKETGENRRVEIFAD